MNLIFNTSNFTIDDKNVKLLPTLNQIKIVDRRNVILNYIETYRYTYINYGKKIRVNFNQGR